MRHQFGVSTEKGQLRRSLQFGSSPKQQEAPGGRKVLPDSIQIPPDLEQSTLNLVTLVKGCSEICLRTPQ